MSRNSDKKILLEEPGSSGIVLDGSTEMISDVKGTDGTDGGSVASLLNVIGNIGSSVLRISSTARRYPEQFNSLEERTKRILMVLIELKVELENNEAAKTVLEDIRSNLINVEVFLLSRLGDRRTCIGLCLSLLRHRWVDHKLEHLHQNLDSCLLNVLIIQSQANKNMLVRCIKDAGFQRYTCGSREMSTQTDTSHLNDDVDTNANKILPTLRNDTNN